MLVLFDKHDNNTNTENLLLLRNACTAGFVHMSKTEWDEMDYFDSLFLLMFESKKNEKESKEMNKGR